MAQADRTLILLADDDRGVLTSCKALLEAASYAVLLASDGKEAIAHLKAERRIQLCLLDVMMPGMTGLETLVLSKLERPSMLVALMSGNSAYEEHALKSGADAFLPKPVEEHLLLGTLSRLLSDPPRG